MTPRRLNCFWNHFVLIALVLLVMGSAICTVAASAVSQHRGTSAVCQHGGTRAGTAAAW